MDPLRLAHRFAQWGGMLGLACGVIYAFGGLIVDARTTGLNWGTLLAFGALAGMPAIAATGGFVLGTLLGIVFKGLRVLRSRDDSER